MQKKSRIKTLGKFYQGEDKNQEMQIQRERRT